MTGRGASVILAAGDFPRKDGLAWRLLTSARRVIACDSAAVAYHRRFNRWPDVIVGDLDSLPPALMRRPEVRARLVKVADQDTNDLTKAISYCHRQRWRNLLIVGACGRREDHCIGNVFRGLAAQIPLVTDFGVFHPVCGTLTFACRKGTAISVFAPNSSTKMSSSGLEWPLDDVRFDNLYCATLNRACSTRVTVTSTHPCYVFESRCV